MKLFILMCLVEFKEIFWKLVCPSLSGRDQANGHDIAQEDTVPLRWHSEDSSQEIAGPTTEPGWTGWFLETVGRWLGVGRLMTNDHQSSAPEAIPDELTAAIELVNTFTGRQITRSRLDLVPQVHEDLIRWYRYAHALQLRVNAAFERNIIILGYMPYSDQYRLPIEPGKVEIVTLNEALNELARTSSESKNLNGQPTGADNHEEQPTNLDHTARNPEGSSTSISSDQMPSHVLYGSPAGEECAICRGPFQSPQEFGENHWSFCKVAKLKSCPHYYHFECIHEWMPGYWQNSCPLCRKVVFDSRSLQMLS
ncbi:hypothetical protein PTTG_28250 [Puccinia triticina 1-1 BBBD Race 1]|uniref:RING-type domain-containing protein n=2 Tax=Puccinia triticina TaxID=208348 RepID=A0A180GDN8_PUCT1|nr:uncharacterized protein PtA15_1A663 [Puccinia triticina]OAV90649.1 hypothetical protein PTTG_28250 [Puccinia triticina 1-1 BBBD Race 1]WAQ81323.1 hypothetical protein PtA15_1A663 [Puccinia triticina]WAR52200.1 hypothetical protein PtB15_1B639 [Puccinia triticina]